MAKLTHTECKHVLWSRANQHHCDIHYAKLVEYYSDGTSVRSLKAIHNFKRPIYITKKEYRNHEQKKEHELISKTYAIPCTDSDHLKVINRALNTRHRHPKAAMESPYVYGVGHPAAYEIMELYNNKPGVENTGLTYCGLDIETNVLDAGKDEIISISLAFENKCIVFVLKSFMYGVSNPLEKLKAAAYKHLHKYIDSGELDISFVICDNETSVIKRCFAQVHKWQPDILGMHAGGFMDIPYIEKRCIALNIDLAELYSDPSVPANERFYNYMPGRTSHTSAKGKSSHIPPEKRWHVVEAPASFYVVDTLCLYKSLRMHEAKESYGLDALLKKYTDTEKLVIADSNKSGLAKHIHEQRNYPVEYMVYSGWDAYTMLLLDKVTKDVSLSLPTDMGSVPFKYKQSSSRKHICHYSTHLKRRGLVLAAPTTLPEDDKVLGGDGWILTLPAYSTINNGCCCLTETDAHRTNIRLYNYDVDIRASYPEGIQGCNVSQSTTVREVIKIHNTRNDDWIRANVNFMSGAVNVIDYCYEMYSMPTLDELLDDI